MISVRCSSWSAGVPSATPKRYWIYDRTEGKNAAIQASDAELLANPYLRFEFDRRSVDPIAFGAVDRGCFRTS